MAKSNAAQPTNSKPSKADIDYAVNKWLTGDKSAVLELLKQERQQGKRDVLQVMREPVDYRVGIKNPDYRVGWFAGAELVQKHFKILFDRELASLELEKGTP